MISPEDAQDGGLREERSAGPSALAWLQRWVRAGRLGKNAPRPSRSPLPCQGPAEEGLGSGGGPVRSDFLHLPRKGIPSLPSPAGAGGIPLQIGRAAGVTTSLEVHFLPL